MTTPMNNASHTILAHPNATQQGRGFGISQLDEALGGGLEPGTTWLLEGLPGGGKSLLALHFIAEGLARGEGGLFISASEPPARLLRAAARNWPTLEAAINQQQFAILDPSPFFTELRLGMQSDKKRQQTLWNEIWRFVQDVARQSRNLNARRIVIDPVSPLLLAFTNEMELWDIAQMLVSTLDHNLGATTLLTHAPFAQPSAQAVGQVLATLSYGVLTTECQRDLKQRLHLKLEIAKQRHRLPGRQQFRLALQDDGHLLAPTVERLSA